MKILDPGHHYRLTTLDGEADVELRFVKRSGPGYPGNEGSYPGTIIQEVTRALIDRLGYLDGQIPDPCNAQAADHLRAVIWLLEERAAKRHGRNLNPERMPRAIEDVPACPTCGHIYCPEHK